MASLIRFRRLTLVVSLIVGSAMTVKADDDADAPPSRIHFRSGGALDGNLISETKDSGRSFVVVRSENGTTMKLDKGRVVQRVSTNGNRDPHYLAKVASMPDTADAHTEIYEWCKSNGGNSKFARQMRYHLKQIVRLDPSDSKAWQRLNYVNVDGRWIPEEQHYQSMGYVHWKGKWVPRIQLVASQQKESSTANFNSKKKALKNWQKNILKVKDFPTVRRELGKILDPSCVVYFAQQYLRKQKNPELRRLFIDAVGGVQSPAAQQILVTYAIEDEVYEVREHAMVMLENGDSFDTASTVQKFSKYLHNNTSNRNVNNAASAIGRLNNAAGIIPLIGAIETKHKVKTGDDPGRMNTSFGNGNTGFSTGGPSEIIVPHRNEGVRQALYDITGQDFGFDSEAWKAWYVDQHTVVQTNLRQKSNN